MEKNTVIKRKKSGGEALKVPPELVKESRSLSDILSVLKRLQQIRGNIGGGGGVGSGGHRQKATKEKKKNQARGTHPQLKGGKRPQGNSKIEVR